MARTTEAPPEVKCNSQAVHRFLEVPVDLEVPPPLHSHFLLLEVQEVLEDPAPLGPLSVPEPAAGIPWRNIELIQVSTWILDAAVLKNC